MVRMYIIFDMGASLNKTYVVRATHTTSTAAVLVMGKTLGVI